jgi:succinate dehydrogenase/fumarate reductase flavoprotein subunit
LDGSVAQEGIARIAETLKALQRKESGRTPGQVLHGIQTAMWQEMGVHKDAASLRRCLQRLSASEEDLQDLYLPDDRQRLLALSLPHLLAVVRVVAQAASMRRESRGPHYRTDAPSSDDSHYGKPIVAHAQGERTDYAFRSLT